MENLRYIVLIERDEDGVYVAKVPDLPGCSTEGTTHKELKKNVNGAIQAYLEALNKNGRKWPAINQK
jgi:predicted RNase H-like HicB family nuclease